MKNIKKNLNPNKSRTNIRNRYLSLIDSSFEQNVGKGNRQNSSVTLGKGVAGGGFWEKIKIFFKKKKNFYFEKLKF